MAEKEIVAAQDMDNGHEVRKGGDVDDFDNDATWGEVAHEMCTHDAEGWARIFGGLCVVLFFLYWFIFGLDLLGTGAKVLTGCLAGGLFKDDMNPIAGLMVGILCTVLLQSSSTTTSIIVSLVGADAIAVKAAIYMIMGANIGTSVTNTIVAMGQMGDGDQLERAFAGATVHDMFNYLSVLILLPLELITGYLYRITSAMVKNYTPQEGEIWGGPLDVIIDPLSHLVIKENKNVIKDIAKGTSPDCSVYYPVECNGTATYQHCNKEGRIGLISCIKDTGACPAFFQEGATQNDDQVSGGVVLFLGLVILCISLVCLVMVLQKMLLGASRRVIYKATNVNGYLAMVVGLVITVFVQSSSVTTSVLTPFCGLGLIRLEQMYPLTLGANIGTTVTALLAAIVSASQDALQVALAHLMFNITGIIIWYPLPVMRKVPVTLATQLGKFTRWWRGFPLLYLAIMFFLIPVVFLGISALFSQDSLGYMVLGVMLVIFVILAVLRFMWFWFRQDGRQKVKDNFERREKKRVVMMTLPEDMEMLKDSVQFLKEAQIS